MVPHTDSNRNLLITNLQVGTLFFLLSLIINDDGVIGQEFRTYYGLKYFYENLGVAHKFFLISNSLLAKL